MRGRMERGPSACLRRTLQAPRIAYSRGRTTRVSSYTALRPGSVWTALRLPTLPPTTDPHARRELPLPPRRSLTSGRQLLHVRDGARNSGLVAEYHSARAAHRTPRPPLGACRHPARSRAVPPEESFDDGAGSVFAPNPHAP